MAFGEGGYYCILSSLITLYFNFGSKYGWGIPFETEGFIFMILKFTFSSIKPMTCFKILFFYLMLNEINLVQFLYGHLKYLVFSLMNVSIITFIQSEPCSINGPKFSKNSFLKFFTLQWGT